MPRIKVITRSIDDLAGNFWKHVEITDGCWMWTGATSDFGHGVFSSWEEGRSKIIRAHRMSWAIEHGRWPDRLVLHRCDVPACVNPDHLYEGDQSDNMRDMVDRGRHHNPAQRLEDSIVEAIRRDAATDMTQDEVAIKHGVSQPYVSRLVRGLRRA